MKKRTLRRITKPGMARVLGFACAMIYAASYIGRLNYSAALPYLLQNGILTMTQGGMISTAYFFAYGAGQLINGIAADRTAPQMQILIGAVGAAAANLLMPMAQAFPAMLVIWTLNGFFQSMIWAPTLLLLATAVPEQQRVSLLWLLNTSPALGSVLSYLFSDALLLVFPWQGLFWGASAVVAAAAGIFWLCGHAAFRGAVDIVPETTDGMARGKSVKGEFVQLLLDSGAILLIVPVMIHGMLKDGTTNWIPTYMSDVFALSAGLAVAVSVVPQLANLLAASVAFWLEKHLNNEVKEAIALFGVAGGSLLLMILFGRRSSLLTIVLFALVTMSMQAVNVVFVSQMPTHFARYGRMATVSGLFNSVAYIGCAVSTYVIALVSEGWGWNITISLWAASAGLSLLLCAAALRPWNKLKASECQE